VALSPSPVVEYEIRGDSVHSDHLAVWCKLGLLPEPKRCSAYKMSTFYLKEEAVRKGIERIWRSTPNLEFFGRLRRCVKFYREFCIRKAKERRVLEEELQHRLTAALAALQSDPANSVLQGQVCEIADRLQGFERRKVEGQRVRSRIKWMKVGVSRSKDFYRAHKHHAGASRITTLDDRDGVSHSAQPEMEHLCCEYYSKLYTREPISRAQEGAREQSLVSIGDRRSEEMKACLRVPIKMHELDEALKGMAVGKSPGPDGVVIEFYKTFWDLFGEEYHRMILSAVESGRLPNGVTRGLISLLHKGGEELAHQLASDYIA
jgi:hypothetical protein